MADFNAKQTGKRLEIHTVLNDGDPDIDALLLIWAKGSEEISQPYTYNVKMWRLVSNERPPIPPADMINTQVAIHVNLKETIKNDPIQDDTLSEKKSHVRRCGVFETFIDEGLVLGTTATVLGKEFHIRQYSATIVPAFKMMAYETAYRVFENKTVIEIIDEVTQDFPNFFINKDRLGDTTFPRIPYCVQYNESTFNFVSRLMAQFGIWYFFDHNRDQNNNISTMMLGTGSSQFDPCKEHGRALDPEHPIHKLTEIVNKDLAPSALIIKDFQRVYAPMTRRGRFSNFNILNPVDPITNVENIQVPRDLIRPERSLLRTKSTANREPDDDDRFRTERFAAPVDVKTAPSGAAADAPDAQSYANAWMHHREALVARVSGSTRNPAMMPGFSFDRMSSPFRAHEGSGEDVIGDEDKAVAGAGADVLVFTNPNLPPRTAVRLGSYVLIRVDFEGLETSYSHQKQDLGEILHDLLFPKNMTIDDVLANSTVQALNTYLQKAVPQNIKDGTMPDLDIETLLPGGSAFGMLGAAIPLILKVIEKLKGVAAENDFHCSFAAIPLERIDYQADGRPTTEAPLLSLPLPAGWTKPLANGPHLAVVIGQDGTDTKNGELFADNLGRVRVRFPWDRKKGEKLGDAFKRGDNACWVRVAEGWAGRQFGTQFLPRIGHEVIVDFLDGDPDRPIITGRIYNADHGFANLPFTKAEVDLDIIEQSDLFHAVGGPEFRFTGIKTESTPKPNGGSSKPRFHLTRFDDKFNCEQYLIRSQGRLDVTAFAHSFETTHGNKHVRVVPGTDKDGKKFGGSEFTTVGGEYDLHIGDARYEGIEKAYNLTVKTDTIFDLQTAHHTIVGTDSTLNAKNIVIEAPIKITLKVGNSFVVLDPAGVWIQGPMVMINSGGTPSATTDQELTDPTDATAAEPGDQWFKRVTSCDPHPPAGGGGRRKRTVKAKHGLQVNRNNDGSLQVSPGIRVRGTPEYVSRIVEDLALINTTQDGSARISRIDSSGRQVTIQDYDATNPHPASPNADCVPGNGTITDYQNAAAPGKVAAQSTAGGPMTDASGNPVLGNGTGTDATVHYDPNDWPDPTSRTKAPGDAILNHELGHADNQTHGRQDMTANTTDTYGTQEEFNNLPNDNAYRRERGVPERSDYGDF